MCIFYTSMYMYVKCVHKQRQTNRKLSKQPNNREQKTNTRETLNGRYGTCAMNGGKREKLTAMLFSISSVPLNDTSFLIRNFI